MIDPHANPGKTRLLLRQPGGDAVHDLVAAGGGKGEGCLQAFVPRGKLAVGRQPQMEVVIDHEGRDLAATPEPRQQGITAGIQVMKIADDPEPGAWRDQRLDLLQLHCPPTDVYYRPEVFEGLEAIKTAGKIRDYGVSVERVEEALKAVATQLA